MNIQAFERSVIVGVLQELASCFLCHHSPSPRTGDQPYWGLAAYGQLRGQLSCPVPEGGWVHGLSPALPGLAAHQTWRSWAGADLAGQTGQPGGTGHMGGLPGAGATALGEPGSRCAKERVPPVQTVCLEYGSDTDCSQICCVLTCLLAETDF